MSAGPLVVEIICTCFLAAFFLHRYGDLRKQHVLVTLFTFIAWYFSFMIIFILPLDVSICGAYYMLWGNVPLLNLAVTHSLTMEQEQRPGNCHLGSKAYNKVPTFYKQCVQDQHKPDITTTTKGTSTLSPNVTSDVTLSPLYPNTTSHLHMSLRSSGEECQRPVSWVPDHVLPALWHVVYWTSQFLTWMLLPIMQSYSRAGDFTVLGKFKSALIENAIYYGTYLLIFGVCLIYVAARPDLHIDGEKLKVIGVTASNTWGLFLLVLLLGYGLVEVPRLVWNNAKRQYMLHRTYFKIAKQSTEKTEAEESLEDVLEEVKQASEKIRYNHSLRQHVDTILLKCPESMRTSVSRNVDYEDYNKSIDTPSENALVKLHRGVIHAMHTNQRHQTQWNNMMQKAFSLEDVISNETNIDARFRHSHMDACPMTFWSNFWKSIYSSSVEWYWKCRIEPWVCRVVAIILTIVSFMVVWSECLFFIKEPVLSVFAVFINLAKENYDYAYIELASILTIAYLCTCAYYSVFQIKILDYYYIAPHHQTNEFSLIFTGMMLCRLTPPLCLNFLGLIHLDSHVTHTENLHETSYTLIMGHMDVIPIISDGFNIYFPIGIVVLCICTYFSLGSRCLHLLGVNQFIGDDDLTQELVDEGREIVRREKRRLERKADSDARRREWTEKFGTSSSTRGAKVEEAADLNVRVNASRYTVPRSPDEPNNSELLNQAEPIDFIGGIDDELDSYTRSPGTVAGYQSQAQHPRAKTHRSVRAPPRGLFDDV